MKNKTDLKLVFLIWNRNITEENWARLDKLGLAGVGLDKNLVTPGYPDDKGRGSVKWGQPTDLLSVIHNHGLKAHCYTFSNEWTNMHWDYGQDPYRYEELDTDNIFETSLLQRTRGVS